MRAYRQCRSCGGACGGGYNGRACKYGNIKPDRIQAASPDILVQAKAICEANGFSVVPSDTHKAMLDNIALNNKAMLEAAKEVKP